MSGISHEQLRAENDDLRRRLEEAEATVEAIRNGDVDAVVVYEHPGEKVYTLEGADQPYRLLVEAMRQGAATVHRDGTVLYCNRCLADLLRTPPERVVGKSLVEFAAESDGPMAAMLRGAAATAARGEVRLRRGDGSVFPAELALSSLPLKDALCLVVTDLTQQKLYDELVEARARLAEADRKKDEFLAMLAHELRNPLAPILTGLHLMKQPGAGSADVETVRAMMQRQVAHLSRLVDDLLDVSRITRGKVHLRKETIDLADVVGRAVETSRPLIESRRHELNICLPGPPVRLLADATRLAQVVGNLLTNAAKYQEEGGTIRLVVQRDGADAVLRVCDRGIGIPLDKLASVFELFTQVDGSVDRSQGGLGIGLTLVKRLVELHGGSVQAHSNGPGTGSEFVIRLPILAEGTTNGAAATTPANEAKPRPVRVLVVDDNRDAADSLAMLLRHWGHEVRVAHDGAAALRAAGAFGPEVVLLDLGMPGMNGYEVCRELRQQHRTAVLAALTGWGQDEDRRKSREAGFDHHLVKPVDPGSLAKLLADVKPAIAGPGLQATR